MWPGSRFGDQGHFEARNRALVEAKQAEWERQRVNAAIGNGTGAVKAVAFSPDATLLASGSQDKSIRLWDTATGQSLHELKKHEDEVNAVAFSSDGKILAAVSLSLWLGAITAGRLMAYLGPVSGLQQ